MRPDEQRAQMGTACRRQQVGIRRTTDSRGTGTEPSGRSTSPQALAADPAAGTSSAGAPALGDTAAYSYTTPVAADGAPRGRPPTPRRTRFAAQRPWFKKKRFLIPGGAVALILVASMASAAGGGGGTPEPTSAAAGLLSASSTPTPTAEPVEATATPTPTTGSGQAHARPDQGGAGRRQDAEVRDEGPRRQVRVRRHRDEVRHLQGRRPVLQHQGSGTVLPRLDDDHEHRGRAADHVR